MGRSAGAILILLVTSNAFGIALFSDLFDGLQKDAEYKSSIPCESSLKEDCATIAGPLGRALDKASSVGLDIQKIIVRDDKSNDTDHTILIKTAKSGICYVNTNNTNKIALKFTCSHKNLINHKLQSVDRVVILKKESNEQFVLEDITQTQNMAR